MAHARNTGSLPVGNVQELAKTSNISDEQVPERYIRVEAGTDEVISRYDSTLEIPVIDLSKLCNPQSSYEERARLGSACQQWGFFQLINHGVPEEVICNLRKDISDFFKLPLEAKKAYSQLPNSLEGYGQVFVVSEEQKLDWADMFYLVLRPNESRDMRFWPAHPPSFRASIDRYSSETAKVVRCLLEFMAMDMGVEPESLLATFQGQPQGFRMNYYPPCRQANKVLGMSPHTDACGLTLLLQVNDVPGLQIRKDGKWFALEALDGAFIVNVGDVLEILSNGRYRSVEHRAVVHPSRERISAAVFHRPCQDALASCTCIRYLHQGKLIQGKQGRMAEIFDKMKLEFVDQDVSVQVVADTIRNNGKVPERYVRPEIKADAVIVNAEGYNLPIIDMSRLLNPEFSEEEIAKLGSACEHWGFFQLVNHGLDEGMLQKIKADITEFFNLPLEEKLAVAIEPNGVQGFGHHFVFSKEQKLDWVDLLFLATRPVEERSLAFWPTKPSTFRDTLDKYSLELANVSTQLLKFMAHNLGVDQDALLGAFKRQPQSVRINYYPPCHQADKVLGLSPHTDGVGMTFLLHVNDVQGLQIKKDGKWFSVESMPGALVVNIGDVLEILTNGKYKSIEHRAIVNPDKERITIAAFHSADIFCTIGPLQDLLKAGQARYKAIDGVEFTKGYFAAKLEVPNVQALAQSCNGSDEQVPERYIRAEAGTDEVIGGHESTSAITARGACQAGICLSAMGLLSDGSQLINHGVPNEVIHDLKKDMAEFFELPLEAKKAYSMLPNSLEGYGQAFVVSEDQKLDWADMFALVLRPVESRDIRFWPAHPPSFRNSIDRYSTETAKVARFLLELMAMDMGIEAESLLKVFQGQPQGLRMNYYPPCRQADKVLGLSPHTDAAGLTLQLQVTDVPGLQIKRDGKWFAVDALDGALLVIIGDILEILSNGRYRCAVHRAVVHPSRERISAAVFHRACQDAVVGPLPELVEAGGGKARYRSVSPRPARRRPTARTAPSSSLRRHRTQLRPGQHPPPCRLAVAVPGAVAARPPPPPPPH
ncbi:hypothetical protein EJB05_23401, partial [Eragrostis curvula]